MWELFWVWFTNRKNKTLVLIYYWDENCSSLHWTAADYNSEGKQQNSAAIKLQASWQISPISMNKQMEAWIGHEAVSSIRFLLASLKSLTHTCVTDS